MHVTMKLCEHAILGWCLTSASQAEQNIEASQLIKL